MTQYDTHHSLPEILSGQDVWVFGYGSLMWRPGFQYLEQRAATLHGYHRSFCIYSHHHRGTPDNPGLVLGLDTGGQLRRVRLPDSGKKCCGRDRLPE